MIIIWLCLQDDFNSGRADKMSEVEEQIDDVREVMLMNIERLLDRGERLDDLLSKAEELGPHVRWIPLTGLIKCCSVLI